VYKKYQKYRVNRGMCY